jgi:predicted kinase
VGVLTLTYMVGVPGSGKSTRARALAQEQAGAVLIVRDNLRVMLSGLTCEWALTLATHALAATCLDHGHSVVIDAMNLSHDDHALWHSLGKAKGAHVHAYVMETPLSECIRRDAERTTPVGESFIRTEWHHAQAHLEAKAHQPAH